MRGHVSVHLPVICLYRIYNTTLRGSVQTNALHFFSSLYTNSIVNVTLSKQLVYNVNSKALLSSTLSDMCN